jgi:hypothetical protein
MEVEKIQLKKISFYLVVAVKWVQYCRWQSKATEQKWQERNYTVKRRLHV